MIGRIENAYARFRLYMHRAVCGSHHAWDQARGESQRDARAREGAARGHEIFVN